MQQKNKPSKNKTNVNAQFTSACLQHQTNAERKTNAERQCT